MNRAEFEVFEAELQKLKPARATETLVERLAVATREQNCGERKTAGGVTQIFNLLYRRFLTRLRCVSAPHPADCKSSTQPSHGGRPPNLRSWAMLRWLAPAAVVVAVASGLWFKQNVRSGKLTGLKTVAQTNPALRADNVEIDRRLLSSFDAVARLPGGEPVRFRCREWVDQVVLRDSRRGVVIEQRTPHLEVVPVGFETD